MNSISETPSIEAILRQQFGEKLQTGVPLAPYTTLRIGGPAQFLLEVETPEELILAYRTALKHRIPYYFFGGCSNVLICDEGLKGLVVINKTRKITWLDDRRMVQVDGGYNLNQLVHEISGRGWGDLSFAAGIPGSLGGALIGGAGAFGHLVHEYLIEARIMRRDASVDSVPCDSLGIGYRTSEARKRGDIILEALLGPFQPATAETLLQECSRILAEREVKHPGSSLPSAGSFFKNLPPEEPGGRRIPAGKLLDEVQVRGLRIGDAGVFEKHANIIVNHGKATAAQVDELARLMAQRVKEKFGIELEREVLYLC